MSQANEQKNDQKKKPIRQGFGGGRGGVGAPIEKPRNFMGSLKRLLGYLKPQLIPLIIVIVFAVVSTIFMIIAPKMLGKATNVLFEGIIGKMMPPNMTKDQAIEFLKFSGRDQIAQMLGPMNIVPGQGVNFSRLATILLTLLGVYALSAFFNWLQQYLMAGVAQKTVYNLRKEVDEKLARLPLKFYDSHPHGDLLSRVTNDIDNIGHTLQQTLVQLITAVVTVIGVLIMMLTISPLLTLITLTVIPLALLVTMFVIKHSQKQFEIQWDSTGELNGHVEESYTGFNVIKAFNKHWDMQKEFDEENERLREATFKAQFVSSLIRPFIGLINNLNYVIVSVVGGLRVANGVMTLGDIQAFIQYSRQFTMPIIQTSSIINVLQSTVASAERVFELLDEEEEIPDPKIL